MKGKLRGKGASVGSRRYPPAAALRPALRPRVTACPAPNPRLPGGGRGDTPVTGGKRSFSSRPQPERVGPFQETVGLWRDAPAPPRIDQGQCQGFGGSGARPHAGSLRLSLHVCCTGTEVSPVPQDRREDEGGGVPVPREHGAWAPGWAPSGPTSSSAAFASQGQERRWKGRGGGPGAVGKRTRPRTPQPASDGLCAPHAQDPNPRPGARVWAETARSRPASGEPAPSSGDAFSCATATSIRGA